MMLSLFLKKHVMNEKISLGMLYYDAHVIFFPFFVVCMMMIMGAHPLCKTCTYVLCKVSESVWYKGVLQNFSRLLYLGGGD